VLACGAGRFSLRYDDGLGRRVIVVCIGRHIVIAIPRPYNESLTMAEKIMAGEVCKAMRREMASSVKRVHAHTLAMHGSIRVERHKE